MLDICRSTKAEEELKSINKSCCAKFVNQTITNIHLYLWDAVCIRIQYRISILAKIVSCAYIYIHCLSWEEATDLTNFFIT